MERPFSGQVACVAGDFFETDFGDGFDAILSTSALYHFASEDKIRLYQKVYDALRPGGSSMRTKPHPIPRHRRKDSANSPKTRTAGRTWTRT